MAGAVSGHHPTTSGGDELSFLLIRAECAAERSTLL